MEGKFHSFIFLPLTKISLNLCGKQECILVGCVPPASCRREVSVQGGFCPGDSLSGGSLSGGLCPGGLHPGGLRPGGLCPGGSLSRGVSVQGVSVQGVFLTETPLPLWTESQTHVKTLPCRNFVAGGKKHLFIAECKESLL